MDITGLGFDMGNKEFLGSIDEDYPIDLGSTAKEDEEYRDHNFFRDDPRFHHDMLTAMIMLGEAKMGNKVSYESASKVSLALMREDEHLPLEELLPKEKA